MIAALGRDRDITTVVIHGIAITAALFSGTSVIFALSEYDLFRYFWRDLGRHTMVFVEFGGQAALHILSLVAALGLLKRKYWALQSMKLWCVLMLLFYIVSRGFSIYEYAADYSTPSRLSGVFWFQTVFGFFRWSALPAFYLVLLRNEEILARFLTTERAAFPVVSAPSGLPVDNLER